MRFKTFRKLQLIPPTHPKLPIVFLRKSREKSIKHSFLSILRVLTIITIATVFITIAILYTSLCFPSIALKNTPYISTDVSFQSICLGFECLFTKRLPKYQVLYNYIQAEEYFEKDQMVTYTTHATVEFLWHVESLSDRWGGPISVGVYCPGDDFNTTVQLLLHLRNCGRSSIRRFVSFHLFFDEKHAPPGENASLWDLGYLESSLEMFDCNSSQAMKLLSKDFIQTKETYRNIHGLRYPINTARNIGRRASNTTFLLAADIELYPSPKLIPRFLKLLEDLKTNNSDSNNIARIFVLPIFEVNESVQIPNTKRELVKLLKAKQAVVFHKFLCTKCHSIPNESKWIRLNKTDDSLGVFLKLRYNKKLLGWEPIYIGTNNEPFYNERFYWEGLNDKMTQMLEMCLMSYDLYILDNAFLVHSPGIKRINNTERIERGFLISYQNRLKVHFRNELKKKYPNNKHC